ncbi:MarR family winged helix-turn-helix transcriptional regulator [Pseudomonas azotoformans]|uniref:MarR family transcriptional regulator n=1 Tax=Pseudomonas azotoformans TaxID=47878 RepID=A0A127I0Z8_PSEAZ|nr:MarR family transcriptional regulator [Pseudomonas azotoformans]AMN80552.1 MarR family transcriptional regulator [Pseudomonas azotoformans]
MSKRSDAKVTPISEEVPASEIILEELVGYALRRAQIQVFQHLVEQLNQFDLRPAQFSALAIIEQNPGTTQIELARSLAIDPPQVVPLVNKLEALALAVRIRSKKDKRSYGLYLSNEGEALLKQLKGVAEKSDMDATANLTSEERTQLLHLLQKIFKPIADA